jgi:hypothetical protein
MESKKKGKQFSPVLSSSISEVFKEALPNGEYELAFRRWLVREINEGIITRREATDLFKIKDGRAVVSAWVKMYTDPNELPLVDMTAEEKAAKQADAKRIRELEKKLEQSTMHIKSLNTLIDVAEEQLNIHIRKKSGAKQ